MRQPRRWAAVAACWGLAAALAFVSLTLRYRLDFDPAGEGYLWYGATRVRHGEVPLRDFRAYDPGRYYWGALWARALGDGPLAQRVAGAAFQAAGLALALLAARRAARGWALAGVGVMLTAWMWPPDKLYDAAVPLAAVLVVSRLLERPSSRRYVEAGALVGVATWIGRNHGLYSLAPVLAAVAWVEARGGAAGTRAARGGALLAGFLIGYSPVIALCLQEPGFFTSLAASAASHLARGSNIPQPVPWPWTASWSTGWLSGAWGFALGLSFLAYAALLLASSAVIARRPSEWVRTCPLLVAATLVALGYAHYVAVRSDFTHLAAVMGPALLAAVPLIALLRDRQGRAAAVAAWCVLVLLTLAVPVRRHAAVEARLSPAAFVPREVGGDRLWVAPPTAALLQSARAAARRLRPGESVLFLPNLPGMYGVVGRRSPVWDVFPLWPADPGHEERMIRQMSDSAVAVALVDLAAVGRPSWDFPRTHPRVWKHLQSSFVRMGAPPGLALFVRGEAGRDPAGVQ